MTKDDAAILKAEIKTDAHRIEARLFRALWIQGTAIVVAVGIIVIVAIALT